VYKICLITYKSLHGLAPQYLSDLLHLRAPSYNTRLSNDSLLLAEPCTKYKSFASRSFSMSAPKLWNGLPYDISSPSIGIFKKKLQTFLFKNSIIFQTIPQCRRTEF
jgi:hypothetical protein